jgi:hypothetical protein
MHTWICNPSETNIFRWVPCDIYVSLLPSKQTQKGFWSPMQFSAPTNLAKVHHSYLPLIIRPINTQKSNKKNWHMLSHHIGVFHGFEELSLRRRQVSQKIVKLCIWDDVCIKRSQAPAAPVNHWCPWMTSLYRWQLWLPWLAAHNLLWRRRHVAWWCIIGSADFLGYSEVDGPL